MAQVGRPKSKKPKDIKYSIRIDAETETRLQAYCEKNNVSKGEAIRAGIELLLKKENRRKQ